MISIDDPKGLMKLKFRCPQCGGSYFGTSNAGNINSTGHCHTYLPDGKRCNYTWIRNEETDAKHFIKKED